MHIIYLPPALLRKNECVPRVSCSLLSISDKNICNSANAVTCNLFHSSVESPLQNYVLSRVEKNNASPPADCKHLGPRGFIPRQPLTQSFTSRFIIQIGSLCSLSTPPPPRALLYFKFSYSCFFLILINNM